ncbi:MAG: hypothetical protein M5U22_09675 [Thermoleophilia bacterium]|nr:hypothetical protein [Thermoleophilia bacterium]
MYRNDLLRACDRFSQKVYWNSAPPEFVSGMLRHPPANDLPPVVAFHMAAVFL